MLLIFNDILISWLESPYARDSKTLLDFRFYAVDSEFLELDSGLCFPDSRAVSFWNSSCLRQCPFPQRDPYACHLVCVWYLFIRLLHLSLEFCLTKMAWNETPSSLRSLYSFDLICTLPSFWKRKQLILCFRLFFSCLERNNILMYHLIEKFTNIRHSKVNGKRQRL